MLYCKNQVKLYYSLIKYGFTNHLFEVVHELPEDIEQQTLDRFEILYWNQYKSSGVKLLNLKEPGKNGRHSEESKKKMSIAQTGKVLSKATREKMKGRVITPEYRDKLSAAQKLRAGKLGFIAGMKGKAHTDEVKQKIAEARKGRKQTKESILKMIESKRKNGTLKHTEEAKAKMRKPKRKLLVLE